MGKAVKKIVGAVVAIGLIVAGVITANPTLIMTGLSVGLSTLKSTKGPKVSPSTNDRLHASIDPRTARKGVFGDTAMNTDIRDQEYTGADKEYLHRFIVTASHKSNAIREIWFDDKLAWTAAGGAQGEFAGYLTVATRLEGTAANAINISARMGATRRFTGCTYVHLRYKLTGNTKKTESPFAQSVPSRLTIIGEGMPVYDPRYDSTVPGGSGPMRANDQTTWAYNYAGSMGGRNPACQLLTYLLGWRIQNPTTLAWKLALGKGVPAARIDLVSFITAANLCDEPVTLAAGGTEPRYRSDGVFSEFDNATDVLDNLKAAMAGELDDMDGLIRLTVLHNDLAVPVLEISDDDVLGDFTWTPHASLEQTRNVIRGAYVDKRPESLYQLIPYPDVAVASLDGIERPEPVSYQFVQSVSQAQRLSKQRLQRIQYAGLFAAEFKPRVWRALKGDIVFFTFRAVGFVAKPFRVVDTDVNPNGRVSVTLREEHPNIYLWENNDAPAVVAVAGISYTNLDLPLSQFLDTVDEGATAGATAGVDLYRTDGTTVLSQADVRTIEGVSSGFVNQAPIATDPTAQIGSTNDRIPDTRNDNQLPSWYRANYPNRQIVEFKDGWALGVPAATAGYYGSLETTVDYSHVSGGRVKQRFVYGSAVVPGQAYVRIGTADDTGWLAWERDFSGYLKPAIHAGDLLDSSGAMTQAGYRTIEGISSGISGQGLFATMNEAPWGSHVSGRPGVLTDLDGGGYLRGYNMRYSTLATVESLRPGEAGANITEGRVSAGISGQGAFATLNSADRTSGLLTGFGAMAGRNGAVFGVEVYRQDATTLVTDAATITSLGVSAGFTGQTAWATFGASTGRVSRLDDGGRVSDPTMYNTSLLLGPNNTTNVVPTYELDVLDYIVTIPAHTRRIAGPSGPIALSYGAGSGVVAYSTDWWCYVDDPTLAGIASPAYVFTSTPADLLYPGRYEVARGRTPNLSGAGGSAGGGGGAAGGGGTFDPAYQEP